MIKISIEGLLSLALLDKPVIWEGDVTSLVAFVNKSLPDLDLFIEYDRDSWYWAFHHAGTFLVLKEGQITMEKPSFSSLEQFVYAEFFFRLTKETIEVLRNTLKKFNYTSQKTDYEKAKEKNLTNIDRWERGIGHHPKSIRLMNFLMDVDNSDYGLYFDWRTGGDGDNGEILMYQLDAFFELLDE